MPCYDGRDNIQYVDRPHDHHNNPQAELLCGLLTEMEKRMGLGEFASYVPRNSKLWHWWQDHKERDRKKAEREAQAKKNELVRLEKASKEIMDKIAKLKKGK